MLLQLYDGFIGAAKGFSSFPLTARFFLHRSFEIIHFFKKLLQSQVMELRFLLEMC